MNITQQLGRSSRLAIAIFVQERIRPPGDDASFFSVFFGKLLLHDLHERKKDQPGTAAAD